MVRERQQQQRTIWWRLLQPQPCWHALLVAGAAADSKPA